MSRFGDEGAVALAEGLRAVDTIERLGLSSCLIGDVGAKALADALGGKKMLVFLDLGWRRGTLELGEEGNVIGDQGALYLGEKLLLSGPVRDIDLTNNLMTPGGLEKFVQRFVIGNERLVGARLRLRGRRKSALEKAAKEICKRNREALDAEIAGVFTDGERLKELERVQEVLRPQHVKEIYSIYRGNM